MDWIQLGATEIRVSRIVYGAMARHAGDPATREDFVRRALELGINTIDTAPLYEFGDSERWIGQALRGRRDQVVVASKVGLRWDGDHGQVLFQGPDRQGRMLTVRRDSRPESVRRDVEESLRRLAIETLDVVQVHHPDPDTPIEDTMGALLDLRKEGKLRHIGVSNYDLAQTRRAMQALGGFPLATLQLPYSLAERRIEGDLLRLAQRLSIGVLAYSPLGGGVLAGKYSKNRPSRHATFPLHHPANVRPLAALVDKVLGPIAENHDVTVATVALAWMLTRRGITAPIIGASRPEHLENAAAAVDLDLRPDELATINRAFGGFAVNFRAGQRRRDRLFRLTMGLAGKLKRRMGR